MIRKGIIILAGLGAAVVSVVSVASADPPTRTYLPAGLSGAPACPGFTVLVTPVIDKEYSIVFSNSAVITTGRLIADVTNLSTGKTIEVNASGPGFESTDGTTITLRGETLLVNPPSWFGPGLTPGAQLVSGVVVVNVAGVRPMILSETGHIRDLCSELA